MFSKDIIDSDRFYDLPFNSQLLYFHLGMHGDVKGFVQPKKVVRAIGLKIEDLKPLIEQNFVVPFESGVVVITHWKVNNTLREDREAPTLFTEEMSRIDSDSRVYALLPANSRSTPAELSGVKISKDELSGEEVAQENSLPANAGRNAKALEELRKKIKGGGGHGSK